MIIIWRRWSYYGDDYQYGDDGDDVEDDGDDDGDDGDMEEDSNDSLCHPGAPFLLSEALNQTLWQR